MQNTTVRPGQRIRSIHASLILICGLIIVAFAYAPGLQGTIHFDDPHNLSGLSSVSDPSSGVDFVLAGNAGPLGRPLSLLSFVPQAYAWPTSTETFLRTNIAIHLINGVLVAWFFYLLCLRMRLRKREAELIAAIGATFWLSLPILASSSLFIVQRMTTLSALFLLVGCISYLYGRNVAETQLTKGLALMTLSVVGFGTLAALAKENGALLPVLILGMEATLLRAQDNRPNKNTRAWQAALLLTPALALLIYLALRAHYDDAAVLMRGYSGLERLLTQIHILWQYLLIAFIPSPSSLGPFHDHTPVIRNWLAPTSLLAIFAWTTAIVTAIAVRKRTMLPLFALTWFLVGHSLESTTIPLELYFEHRNYVPLIGPVFAIAVAIVVHVPTAWRTLSRLCIGAYIALLLIVLHSTTSLWGTPALAAEMWVKYNPGSLRATQYLAEQLEAQGEYATARRMLRIHIEEFPEDTAATLQILALSCTINTSIPAEDDVTLLKEHFPSAPFSHGAVGALTALYDYSLEHNCEAFNSSDIIRFAELALDNRAFLANAVATHNLHLLLARDYVRQRDLDATMHHLEAALAAYPSPSTARFAVAVLNSAGLHETSNALLEDIRARRPRRPLRAIHWSRELAKVEAERDSLDVQFVDTRSTTATFIDDPERVLPTNSN
jgi:protein O-mannosyl-transferase